MILPLFRLTIATMPITEKSDRDILRCTMEIVWKIAFPVVLAVVSPIFNIEQSASRHGGDFRLFGFEY